MQRTYRVAIQTAQGRVFVTMTEADYRAYRQQGNALTESQFLRFVAAKRVTK